MENKENSSLHEGHRQRFRNRYLKEGLDSFEPHEVLEFLLFYSIPQRDVNALGHRLIEQFGSLANVFDADVEDLKKVDGVGETTAILLNLIPALSRLYSKSKWDRNVTLASADAVGQYAISMYIGKKNEEFGIICLDSNRSVHYSGIISIGTVNQAEAYPRRIVEEVLKHKAVNVILTHNHPNGSVMPSDSDKEATKLVVMTLEAIGINVLDHVIVSGERFFSMADMGLMD